MWVASIAGSIVFAVVAFGLRHEHRRMVGWIRHGATVSCVHMRMGEVRSAIDSGRRIDLPSDAWHPLSDDCPRPSTLAERLGAEGIFADGAWCDAFGEPLFMLYRDLPDPPAGGDQYDIEIASFGADGRLDAEVAAVRFAEPNGDFRLSLEQRPTKPGELGNSEVIAITRYDSNAFEPSWLGFYSLFAPLIADGGCSKAFT